MEISIPGVYMICGLQGSGKSWLIKYLMYMHRKEFDVGIVFTNTGFVQDNFDYIDKRFLHLEYSPTALKNLKSIFEKQIVAHQENPKVKKLCGFVIFDDCITGKQWKEKELKSLITQVRHYNLTVIISTQYPTAIDPLFRTNTFQCFMFLMTSENAMKALYSNYGQMIGTFADFKAFYLAATSEKHQFLAYNAQNGGSTIKSRYQVYICPEKIPDFKVGTKLLKREK